MIDWDRVAQLREEVGPDDFAEVVELFLEEVEEVIRRLTAAPDPATLAEDLHFLKGSALNLGFERFGQTCREGEKMASGGKAGTVMLAPILGCYAASRQAFLKVAGPPAQARTGT